MENGTALILVLDCGATNVRAVVVDAFGRIAAQRALPNSTRPDPDYPSGLIWDVEEIWTKLVECTRDICGQINPNRIRGITVTTFGVNGAPVDARGKMLYPVISWQCQRTLPIMQGIDRYIPVQRLYDITGVNAYSFNTINTLIWLKENMPNAIDRMEAFLFLPSLFVYKLTGNMVNDTTMAGTSMLTDIRSRAMSGEILSAIGVPNRFAELSNPGDIAGLLTTDAASTLGLPQGIPVVIAGHDTQFALIGSGAELNEVVLSSGTWDILMSRVENVSTTMDSMAKGVTNELDALPGLFNTGIQWLASGTLEWIRRTFFTLSGEANAQELYETMIAEGMEASTDGVGFSINLAENAGSITGIGLHTTRGQIYRAALESLAKRTKESLETLEHLGQFKAKSLIVVGGGSRNQLLNQLRANEMKIPLKLLEETEGTVIGAATLALVGAGVYRDVHEAKRYIVPDYKWVYPEEKG